MYPLSLLLAFWTPGPTELIVILVIVLIIFGVGKLPEIGKGLGKGIKEFKNASTKKDELEASVVSKEEDSKEEDKE